MINEQKTINRTNSLCMILVVMTHCVITRDCVGAELFYLFIFRTFTRIAVPIFFILSGYLLLKNYSIRKIKKRTKTVFIPFLLWSIITIGIFYTIKLLPTTRPFVNTNIEPTISYFIESVFISPLNGSLWFLRDLYVFVVISPFIYNLMCNKFISRLSIAALFILWIIDLQYRPFIESSFFFIIGAFLSLHNTTTLKHLMTLAKYSKTYLVYIYFIFIILLTLIFSLRGYNPIMLSKLSIILGLPAFLIFLKTLNKDSKFNIYLDHFKRYSFFCYVTHIIFAQFLRKFILSLFPPNNLIIVIIYYLIILLLTFLLCVISQKLLTRISPKLVKILTGNRC